MARRWPAVHALVPALPAPWHLLAGLMRWNAIGLARSRQRAAPGRCCFGASRGAAQPQAAAEVPPGHHRGRLAAADRANRPALCDWLWHPLAIAALNQSPDVAAAAPFVRVLGELFAPDPKPPRLACPWCRSTISTPSRRGDSSRRARPGSDEDARAPSRSTQVGHVAGVRADGQLISAPVVVSTVPWHAFARIWDGDAASVARRRAANAAAMAAARRS